MDLFAADNFPVPDTPFPDSGDLLYAAIPPSLRHNPQKLRPIRSSSSSSSAAPAPAPAPASAAPSSPLHDAAYNLCLLNTEPCVVPPIAHLLEPSVAAHHSLAIEEDPVGSGSGRADALPFHLGQESDSSLDDGGGGGGGNEDENSSGSAKESTKKRRKKERKLEHFVENLVKKVMEKQEQMHKQLVDMIEIRERERVLREEAWKQQEMERIKRDEEARARERSQNLALISLIQNLLGQEIQIPQPAELSSRREDDEHEGEADFQKNFGGDASNNRWPDVEVQALITMRTSMEHKFRLMGSKVSIWEEISEAMQKMGYNRSAKKCKEKWENMNKYYKRTIGCGKKRRENSKTCPYFNELEILHRNGLVNVGNSVENSLNNASYVSKIEKE